MTKKAGITLLVVSALTAIAVAAATAATDGAGVPQAKAAPAVAGTSTATCTRTTYIGVAAPLTGGAASIGTQQLRWAQFYVANWNKANPKRKFKVVQGDTQLPNVAEAIKVAKTFASDKRIYGVVGPAGSQEVQDSFASYKAAGLGFVSGSATRTSLTDGSRKGYFYRVVPNDDSQGPSVASYIQDKVKATRIYIIDDQETYSQGLADTVEGILKAKGDTVARDSVSQTASDFSSLIAKIPANTQVVYIPWQLAAKAQLFGQQLKAGGKNATLFGSDGLFDPASFTIAGSYVSFFPLSTSSPLITGYKAKHSGNAEYFGAPSGVAAQVVMSAIAKACADGKISRAEVRKAIGKTNFKTSLLGLPVSFTTNGDIVKRPFGIYQIGSSGVYNRVG
jgi:branched-chain amino acid transport system substrate-binding protein